MLARSSLLRAASIFGSIHPSAAAFSSVAPGISTMLSAEETAIRDSAAKFARDILAPNAQRMDRDMKMDPAVLKAMFSNGFMGIEIPSKFGGAEQTFVSSCIVIEEFAKADATLSGAADIQNTLINTAFRKFASEAQQERYLPRCIKHALQLPQSNFFCQACSRHSRRFLLVGTWQVVIAVSVPWICARFSCVFQWQRCFCNENTRAARRGQRAVGDQWQ